MLETKELVKIYKPKKGVPVTALNKISLKFPEKGMVFLLGKSGSGKSTLLNVLGGLDKYDGGEIIIKGVSSKNFRQQHFDSYRNTYVGFIFQEYNVLDEFSVGANIALAIELQGRRASDSEINDILKQVDLEGFGARKPNELSGGQKRRVAIAGVMAMEPRVLILDEPTAGLDPAGRDKILSHIKSYHERTRNTILIVSHSMEDIATFADRILVMNKSELFCFDETKKVFARADEIAAIGLDVPQITKVFGALRSRGLDFGKEVYTVGYARELVLRELRERGGL